MKISIYAQELLKNNKTGVGWTLYNILDSLSKNYKHELSLDYFSKGYDDTCLNDIMSFKEKGIRTNPCNRFNDIVYQLVWNVIPIPYFVFFGNKSDVTQFFNYYIPPGVKGKKVTVIYDMTYKVYPETIRKRTLFFLKLNIKKACRRADKIITISEFSKDEIIKYLKVDSNKIVVIPCGVDKNKFHCNYAISQIDSVKAKYGIMGDYFLYLGTLEPRKNIVRLVKAYSALIKEKSHAPKLVLAGRKGWQYEEIFDTIKEASITDCVIFTDYIDEVNVPLLMAGAISFVFPSIYEGFGLPPLEAMACGTPVITSNVASMPEVVGDAAITVNPLSIEEIKEAMVRIMETETTRKQLRDKGLERVKQYTWDNAADLMIQTYHTLLEEENIDENCF